MEPTEGLWQCSLTTHRVEHARGSNDCGNVYPGSGGHAGDDHQNVEAAPIEVGYRRNGRNTGRGVFRDISDRHRHRVEPRHDNPEYADTHTGRYGGARDQRARGARLLSKGTDDIVAGEAKQPEDHTGEQSSRAVQSSPGIERGKVEVTLAQLH